MSNIFLAPKKFDSKSELISDLLLSKIKTVLLGENAQQCAEFIEIVVEDTFEQKELLKIGVISEGHGLKPQYTIIEQDNILIGFNKEICLISVNLTNKILKKEFESLFYELKYVKNLDRIVVVCETEVFCLATNLEVIWHIHSDLIMDFEITETCLKVVTEEAIKLYSLVDGRKI